VDDPAIPSWTRRLGSNEDYVKSLLDRLAKLREQSDPIGSDETKSGKDARAFDALEIAGKLVEAVAGWAVDHTIGATREHDLPLSAQPHGTKNHPTYVQTRESIDDHRHEGVGSQNHPPDRFANPARAQRALIALLEANSGGWPHDLRQSFIEALEALPFGEQMPLISAVVSNKKVGWREMCHQLRAICCVEYRYAKGFKKFAALKHVAAAYGVESDTVRTWEQRLRQELGDLMVSREIAFAKNRASTNTGESLYGDAVLAAHAERYWAVKKTGT
jgi:hypothetical protein